MIYRLIRWLLNKFNYELVDFAEMKFYTDAVNERAAIAEGKYKLEYFAYSSNDGLFYEVTTKFDSPVNMSVKKFYIEDYGSVYLGYIFDINVIDKYRQVVLKE